MGELLPDPLGPSNFNVVDSFTADNGITYRKVEYKGIEATGYLSEPREGVLRKITEDYFKRKDRETEEPPPDLPPTRPNKRVTVSVNNDYDPEYSLERGHQPEIAMNLEVGGVIPPGKDPVEAINDVIANAAEEVPFTDFDVRLDTNVEVAETRERTTGLDGSITYDQYSENTYEIKDGKVQWPDT